MGIGETSTWAYTADVARLTEQDLRDASLPTRVITGKVASGRSFSTDSTGMQWMREMDVAAKDMESAAAMSTCLQFGVQSTCLKVVVTLVRGEEEDMVVRGDEEFDTQRKRCIPCLARTTEAFVNRAREQLVRSKWQQMMMLGSRGSSAGAAPLSSSPFSSMDRSRLIVIHIAMEEEAAPIANALGLCRTVLAPFARHGMPCWTGTSSRSNHVSIVMVSHGTDHLLGMSRVSTQIATLCTNIIISTYGVGRLSLVINCGTAGAMSGKSLDIGSIVVADEVKFIDARGLEGRSPPLQVWSEGSKTVASKLTSELRRGVVGTGSSFDLSPSDLSSLKELDVDVKEMEAASVVWVCNQFHVPVLVVKSVTDFVEHEEEGASEFHENLYGKALDALSRTMPLVVDVVVEAMVR
jgi:nucleoside phosphorylase